MPSRPAAPLLATFTDFGATGPYRGQLEAVLLARAPGVPVMDLLCDAPGFDPRASAYLLAATSAFLPDGTVVVAVVDPGVGSPSREPVVVSAGSRWFVGPGNGLLGIVAAHDARARFWRIDWRPSLLSPTFHGRDLFAPVAAMLALGEAPPGPELDVLPGPTGWSADLPEVIYLDGYGNAWTGLRGESVDASARLGVAGRELGQARTFSDVERGEAFWYVNSSGLVEVAVNQGSAAEVFALQVGSVVEIC